MLFALESFVLGKLDASGSVPFLCSAIAELGHGKPDPAPWMVLPFLILLLSIAAMPFLAPHFWERHYPKVALGLASITS